MSDVGFNTQRPGSAAAQMQRRTALTRATARRAELAKLNAQLRNDAVSLSETLRHPPETLANRMVWRILLDAGVPTDLLGDLNDDAIQQRVNLAAPVGMLSSRQRNWLAAALAAHGR
jgi:hypothetical protein